jgi:O-antigen/teichoic acid export membrane protein
MSLGAAVAKNTIIQVGGKLVGTVLGLVTISIMTRHLGAAGYGDFTTAMSFLQVFGTIVDFGLTLTMLTMLSKPGADEDKVASNIVTLRVISGVLFMALAPIVALAFPYSGAVKTSILIGTMSFLAITMTQVMSSIFQRHLRGWTSAMIEMLGRAALLGMMVWVIASGRGLIAAVVAVTLSNVAQVVLSFVFARGLVRLRPAFDLSLWREVVRDSWPVGVSIMFNLIYLKGDVIIMSLYRSSAEIGLYGAAYKVLDVLTVIPVIFMGALTPHLTASWHGGDRGTFARRLRLAFDALSMMAIPLAIGAVAVSRDVMVLVSGAEYAEAGKYLAILIFGAAAVFWNALFNFTIVALGMQKKMILAFAIDALLSLGLYFAFVPIYGAVAAAWVTVFSEVLIAVIAMVVATMKTGVRVGCGIFVRALGASGVMYVALVSFADAPVLVRIGIGVAVYFVVLWAIGGLRKEFVIAITKKATRPNSPLVGVK